MYGFSVFSLLVHRKIRQSNYKSAVISQIKRQNTTIKKSLYINYD